MTKTERGRVTEILAQSDANDRAILEQLIPKIYDELRRMAQVELSNERVDHTLQATALVNEAFLRFAQLKNIRFRDRKHLFGAAAEIIRRVLVDHARAHNAAKRGGGAKRVDLDANTLLPHLGDLDVQEVDEAIEALSELDARQAKIVNLRIFGGHSTDHIAKILGISQRTVQGDWRMAKQWLRRRLEPRDVN